MSDDLKLRVQSCTRNGNSYTLSNPRVLAGWQDVRFTRGVERCPSDFDITMTERYPNANPPEIQVQPGDFCEVLLGNDKVSTGWIDRFAPSFGNKQHRVQLTGRSKCADLVDCAAVYNGLQIANASALAIAQTLCAPFGITASATAGTNIGDPVPQVVILAGETAYDVLERVCRYRALLLYDGTDGNLVLSGIGTKTASSGFKEGVNVQSASAVYSMDQRFSDYYTIYQGLDQFSDVGGAPNQIAHVSDTGVQRYRPRVVISENVIGGSIVAAQRANWEAARRAGRSFAVRIVTDSWRDSSGALYAPNTLVPLILPSLKLGSDQSPKTWVVSEVSYKKGEAGTTAELLLMPPSAFYQEPFIWAQIGPDQKVS